MIPWWALVAIGALEWSGVLVRIAWPGTVTRQPSPRSTAIYLILWGSVGTILILAGLAGVKGR